MDGDRDRDAHWSTGLSSQGQDEEQKGEEHEQRSQDLEGCVHPLRLWDWSNGSSLRPAGLGAMEHVIKLDTLNVTGNEGWLRSQGQWHWVLILWHGLTCGSLVCLDAHLYRYGWRGEDLGLPRVKETLTALRTRERGWGGEREEKGRQGGGGNF